MANCLFVLIFIYLFSIIVLRGDNMLQPQDITDFMINTYLNKGDIAVDATAGNGNDTLKLAKPLPAMFD